MKLTIYFHRDFDGTAAAALLTAIYQKLGNYQQFIYKPVDFDIKNAWLQMKLEQPSAIVDFFYHPDAAYYYDHHDSSILEQYFGKDAVDTDNICFSNEYKSTPAILKYKFEQQFDFAPYADLLRWSDIIDNAEYSSPHELYDSKDKYILLNKLLGFYQDQNNNEEIIKIIPYILDAADVILFERKELLTEIIQREQQVIQDLRKLFKIAHNISFVDQSDTNFAVQRFVSYYFNSELDYQIIIYRKNSDFMVNFGRNPWRSFNSQNLGEIATKYGGFGRKDVGGILVKTHSEATGLANKLISELAIRL